MTATTMAAYRIPAIHKAAEWTEIPVPNPDPGEVLLRMDAAGLCRSDLEIMDHGVQFVPYKNTYTLGHENAGSVVALGDGVTDLEVGETLIVNSGMTCGRCSYCLAGRDNFCSDRPGYYGLSDDGGFAPYMLARRRDLLPLLGLDPVMAVPLADAGGTAYAAVNTVLPFVEDSGFVVVIGVGGLGSFALQFLRLRTTATIIAVDVASKLDHARARGAGRVLTIEEATTAALMDITGGRGVDAVMDLVGTDATLELAAQVTRPLGCINLVGTGGGTLPFHFQYPELGVRVFSAASYSLGELQELVALTRRGLITVDVTRFAFRDLEAAFDELRAGKITGRAVVTFDGD